MQNLLTQEELDALKKSGDVSRKSVDAAVFELKRDLFHKVLPQMQHRAPCHGVQDPIISELRDAFDTFEKSLK